MRPAAENVGKTLEDTTGTKGAPNAKLFLAFSVVYQSYSLIHTPTH